MTQHTPLQQPRHASNPACRDPDAPRPTGSPITYLRLLVRSIIQRTDLQAFARGCPPVPLPPDGGGAGTSGRCSPVIVLHRHWIGCASAAEPRTTTTPGAPAWALAEYQGRQDLCCATGGGRSCEGQHARALPTACRAGKVCRSRRLLMPHVGGEVAAGCVTRSLAYLQRSVQRRDNCRCSVPEVRTQAYAV